MSESLCANVVYLFIRFFMGFNLPLANITQIGQRIFIHSDEMATIKKKLFKVFGSCYRFFFFFFDFFC